MYKWLREKTFLDTKYGLQAYTIALVWLFFIVFWLPTHAPASEKTGLFLLVILPFVLPFYTYQLLIEAWYEYNRERRYWATEHCVLEIRLPEEITQTPRAMELALRGLYQTGEVDTPVHEFWGNTKAWFSLELVSIGGQVRFYIWLRRRYKNLVESQIYAHYPTVQIVEVPDYTLSVPYDPRVVSVWGIEQALQKPDPYPILTYVEMGMDQRADLKEEFKNDPLAAVIEMLGSLKEGENIWIQMIIRAHTECAYSKETAGIGEEIPIQEWAEKEIEKITEKVTEEKDGHKRINFMGLTQGDKRDIEAIQNKLNKQNFDVGMRVMYIASRAATNNTRRASIPSVYRSFEHGSEGRGLNGLKPIFWIGPFNFVWHDFMNIRRFMLWKRFYRAYVSRQFFYTPHKHRHIVLNLEEIATLYHFPGQVVRTPTLAREPSRRSEAPANLPV